MIASTARLRQVGDALVFCSPANWLFDGFPPETPRDGVYLWENPLATWKEGAAPSVRLLTDDVEFPNDALPTPPEWSSFLTSPQPVIVSSGRFPIENSPFEGGQAGEIFILDGDEKRISISGLPDTAIGSNKWYYGDFLFRDVNKDGRLDIITGRQVEAPPPFPGHTDFWNQLVWFEQPSTGADQGDWPLHYLLHENFDAEIVNRGPSLSMDMKDTDGDGVEELIFAEFWGERIAMLHTDTNWTDARSIQYRTVIDTLGSVYSTKFEDVAGDGSLEIIAGNHAMGFPFTNPKGLFVALEIPAGWKDDDTLEFPLHVIDNDFPTRNSPFSFAPGFFTVIPTNNTKPLLALTTDGAGDWHLYTPVSDDSADFVYSKSPALSAQECDFIAPEVYTDRTTGDRYLVSGCHGGGVIHAGQLVE